MGVAQHVLVTGAGGYIGSLLTAMLLEKGHRVTAVDRLFFGEETLAPLRPSERLTIVRDRYHVFFAGRRASHCFFRVEH